MHRAKLAFANRLSSVLAEAVNLGFEKVPEPGSGRSPRNAFVKMNWDNGALVRMERGEQEVSASGGALPGEWGIVPRRLFVAHGPRYIGQGMTAEVRDGKLYVVCPDLGLDEFHAVGDDRLMPTVHLYPGPLRKACHECSFALPTDLDGGKSRRTRPRGSL